MNLLELVGFCLVLLVLNGGHLLFDLLNHTQIVKEAMVNFNSVRRFLEVVSIVVQFNSSLLRIIIDFLLAD